MSQAPLNYNFEPVVEGVVFDGQAFDLMATQVYSYSSIPMKQNYYATVRDGFAIVIVTSYMARSQKVDIDKMLETMEFNWD